MPSFQEVQFHQLARRDETDSDDTNGKLTPTYIAGIVFIIVLVLGISIWLVIRHFRNKRTKERQAKLDGAFLSIRGVVKDGSAPGSEKSARPQTDIQTNSFSRNQLNAGIVMPEKTLGPRSREEIMNFHRQSGNFPKPFSFAKSAGSGSPSPDLLVPPSPGGESRRGSWIRHSFMSYSSGAGNRFSVQSSVASSFGNEPTTGTTRKVKQVFSPVLPDELLLTHPGEQLTVVQSFDDGWCVVGREDNSGFKQKKSLFSKPEAEAEGDANVELGVVPAWVFLKPVKGLKAERPVRSTSLGVTVQMASPALRDSTVSWSNF
ncbi:hypothetical protein D9611_001568 [Ephemerocybe angulata]|uniref:SH3 domain-containing protein n=1 Tax=Ephemerocybe angulata TaxID=980116 RepID=A0A8H5CHZ2_9AGAR|nr:hypothetical protein D9611_001568 [Tulosesus angulatus]